MLYLTHPRSRTRIAVDGDLDRAWHDAMADLRQSECSHQTKELRVRQLDGNRKTILAQCLICGEGKGNAVAQTPENLASPPWDEVLMAKYIQERQNLSDAITIKYCDLALEVERKLEVTIAGVRLDYEEYRRSEKWQKKRALVLRRAGGLCEGCMAASADIVHHTTYRNIGDELLFELVALCHGCHAKAHPEHHESFYDFDYSPCTDCRWGEGQGMCGRFDQARYLALSADGACGPRWAGFEGIK